MINHEGRPYCVVMHLDPVEHECSSKAGDQDVTERWVEYKPMHAEITTECGEEVTYDFYSAPKTSLEQAVADAFYADELFE